MLTALCCACLMVPAAAHELPTVEQAANVQRIDFEDGGYCIWETALESYGAVSPNQTSGQKTAIYYNGSDEKIFSVTVYGTFTYNGTSASATSAEAYVAIYDAGTEYVTSSASTRGGTASASGTVKYNSITYTLPVSLTCSKNGALS